MRATVEEVGVSVTVAGATVQGYLAFYPGDQVPPTVSTINFLPNVNRANNAILRLLKDGVLGVQAFGETAFDCGCRWVLQLRVS